MSLGADVLAFAAVAGLLTVIPGLDTALVLRAAISQDRRRAFATALGVNSGVFVWGVGAAAGVSALLTASTLAYTVLRFVGATYILILGIRFLREAWHGARAQSTGLTPSPGPEHTIGSIPSAWRRGLITNLANPKVGAFYVALLPQFIPYGAPHLLVGLMLATIHNLEGIAWFTVLILSIESARKWMTHPRVQRVMDAVTGLVLIGFGVRLVASER